MKKLLVLLLIALCIQCVVIAKGNKKQKHEKAFSLNTELKGFEIDYLTNKDFKAKVESQKIWGILEIIIDWVASLFNSSYGKYDEDSKNQDGPYFIFDRSPNGLSIQ